MKSLKPSSDADSDYVLIHKRALLINTFVIARLSRVLSDIVQVERDQINAELGDLARDEVNSLSTEEINDNIQKMIQNSDTEKGFTVVK